MRGWPSNGPRSPCCALLLISAWGGWRRSSKAARKRKHKRCKGGRLGSLAVGVSRLADLGSRSNPSDSSAYPFGPSLKTGWLLFVPSSLTERARAPRVQVAQAPKVLRGPWVRA